MVAVDNEGNRSAMSDTVIYRISIQGTQSSSGGTVYSGGSASVPVAGEQTNTCVDPDGDGWGWDGSKSCKMANSSSAIHTTTISTNICVDEDGDGYGWNGYKTCLIDQAVDQAAGITFCIDIDGDGYGWDGSKTCMP